MKQLKSNLSAEILFNLVIVMVFSILLISLLVLKFTRDVTQAKVVDDHNLYASSLKDYFENLSRVSDKDWFLAQFKEYVGRMESGKKGMTVSFFGVSGDDVKCLYGCPDRLKVEHKFKEEVLSALGSPPKGPAFNTEKFLWTFSKIISVESYIPLSLSGYDFVLYLKTMPDFEERGLWGIKVTVIIFTSVFAFVVVVFGYFLLSRSVIRPLNAISKKAALIANGRLDISIGSSDIKLDNEIGVLGKAIKTMTDKLLSNQRELEKNLEEMKNLNRALNAAQMEIVRAEKLASIGRLSSGLAHEIGNPLSAVLGYLDILKKDATEDEEREMFDRALGELQRISVIIKQLLEYSRPAKITDREVDLAECLSLVMANLKVLGTFDEIEVKTDMIGSPALKVDDSQLKQVIVNLVKNAADAVREKFAGEKGGKIVIGILKKKTRELDELKNALLYNFNKRKDDPPGKLFLEDRAVKRKGDPAGVEYYKRRARTGFPLPKFLYDEDEELIKLTVEDNGIGIKREDVFKIFEPFYTTKDPGKGTGLGLYMTLNIVDAMGGYVDLLSEYGKGTLFMVLLPIKRGFS